MAKMCFQFLFVLLVALQVDLYLVKADDYEDGKLMYDSSNEILIPETCKGQPFCFDKGENYPHEMIDELVKNLRNMEIQGPEDRSSIGSRSGNRDTESDCKAIVTNDPIYYITDTNNKQRVVVQSKAENHFRQYYDVTWCSKGGPASNTPNFLQGVKCVNKTMDLDFFVLRENEISQYTKITVARATIPVCCRCELDKNKNKNN